MRSIYGPTLYLLLLTITLIGCGQSDQAQDGGAAPTNENSDIVQTDTQQQTQAPTGPINTGLQPDENYPVPHLAPAELLGYINQLATLEPYGDSDDEYIADQISRARSRLIAADRIILTRGIDNNLMEAAVKAKLDSLRLLALIDPKGLGVHFDMFVDALNKGDSPEYARTGRINQFWFEVDKLMYGQTEDPEPLITKLKELIGDKDAGEAEFLATQDAGFVLNDRGFPDKATEVLNLVGTTFKDHEELGKEAKELLEKTAFREKVIAAMNGGKSEIRTLFIAIRDMLKDDNNLDVVTLDNTLNAGQVLEFNGHFEEAGMVFQAIKKAYAKGDNAELAKQAEVSVSFAEKRLGVVGKGVDIEGVQMDGTAFNWEKYKGKVVLVDFWASTSSPWQSALPSVKAAYDKHHDEGFEVVGINVDRDRQNAYDYLRGDRLPWTMIMDEVAPGLESNPNAIRYGVRAVPFVMLVGRDGKVADIHVRGQELTKRVTELLEMPSSKNAKKATASRK